MTDTALREGPGLRPGEDGYEEMVSKIRYGTTTDLELRQERWDRIQKWSKTNSLAQMVDLEEEVSGYRLSRERIRAILNKPRPGTVGRPKLPGLLAVERTARERYDSWQQRDKAKSTEQTRARLAESRENLRAASAAVKAERKRTR